MPDVPPGVPVLRPDLVLRPRLLDRLADRFAFRLTVVTAPAGFGKTTLLAQAVHHNARVPRGVDHWLTCRPEHELLSELASALQTALAVEWPSPTSPAEVAAAITDALWARAPEQVALVLDDAHLLGQGTPGAVLVRELVEQLPRNAHLVLGRRPVPSDLHDGLVSAKQLTQACVLGAGDLAFRDDELSDFAHARHVPVQRLRGPGAHPVMAELLITTGRGGVTSYLREEVLAHLPQSRRRALAALQLAGPADEELAAAVAGVTDLPALLEDLPLVTATDDGRWSLHGLWEAPLRGELEAVESAEVRRATARVLQRRGRWHEAMRQLLAAQAWPEVRAMIVDACGSFSPLVSADVLQEWWDSLPVHLQSSPEGLLLAGMAREAEDPEEGVRLLEQAYGAAGGRGEVALSCVQSLVMISYWRSDTRRLPALHDRLEVMARDGVDEAAAYLSFSRALQARDVPTVLHEMHAAPLLASARLQPAVEWLRAHLQLLHLGDPATAEALAGAALPRVPATLRSSVLCELLESLRLQGRTAESEAVIVELRDALPSSIVRTPRHLLAAVVARAARGDAAGARALLPALQAMVGTTPIVWAPWAAALGEAHVLLAEGQEEQAGELLAPLAGSSARRCQMWSRINPSALPVLYVLAPGSRASWDGLRLPGCFEQTRQAAAALVELRGGSPAAARALPVEQWRLAGPLPLPWAVELWLVRMPLGRALVDACGQAARPSLERLKEQGGDTGREAATALKRLRAPTQPVELQVLGPLRVSIAGQPVTDDQDLRRDRVRALLAHVMLRGPVHGGWLAERMWPDLDQRVAGNNLRTTLGYLQRLLQPLPDDDGERYHFVHRDGQILELVRHAALTVDLWRFEDLLRTADADVQHQPSKAIPAYRAAVALYRGELFADLPDEEWLDERRVPLRDRYVRACVRLAQLLLVASDAHSVYPEEVEDLARRALAADPWCEAAFQLLASLHLAAGDRAAASRVLDDCRERLADLGVDPQPSTVHLEEQVHGRTRRTGGPARPAWAGPGVVRQPAVGS